jgi:hypothetical protein
MIEVLKEITFKKIGFKIKTRGDCHHLADMVYTTIQKDISYNTLRRFFGLDKKMKPSKKTLDIISEFNGFTSYTDFLINYPKHNFRIIKEEAFKYLSRSDDKSLISFLSSVETINENLIDIIINIFRELILQNRYDTIKKLFDHDALNPKFYNYSELIYLCNSIGSQFRKVNSNYKMFYDTKYFNQTVFTTFVDYSSLNKNYGKYAQYVYKQTKNKDLKLFSGLLTQFRRLLNNKKVTNCYEDFVSDNTHPILLSRFISMKIILEPKKKHIEILKKYTDKHNNSIDYYYEIMTSSLLTKNFDLMSEILKITPHQSMNLKYYQEWHYSNLKIIDCFVMFSKGGEKELSKQLTFISNLNLRYSYDEFYEVFLCIIRYHLNIKKELQLSNYNKLSKKLNYPILNETFLINYF